MCFMKELLSEVNGNLRRWGAESWVRITVVGTVSIEGENYLSPKTVIGEALIRRENTAP
jgi:hypothetical protein